MRHSKDLMYTESFECLPSIGCFKYLPRTGGFDGLTWSPDTPCGGGLSAVEGLVPLPEQVVNHTTLRVEHLTNQLVPL